MYISIPISEIKQRAIERSGASYRAAKVSATDQTDIDAVLLTDEVAPTTHGNCLYHAVSIANSIMYVQAKTQSTNIILDVQSPDYNNDWIEQRIKDLLTSAYLVMWYRLIGSESLYKMESEQLAIHVNSVRQAINNRLQPTR